VQIATNRTDLQTGLVVEALFVGEGREAGVRDSESVRSRGSFSGSSGNPMPKYMDFGLI
jgi:hypothetical protein